MAFGNEVKDFMAALGAGTQIQSDIARGAYYRQAQQQQAYESKEYQSPDAQADRIRQRRAAADTAWAAAQKQQAETAEFVDPANVGLRQRERQAIVGNQEATLDYNRSRLSDAQLDLQKKQWEWIEAQSPRARQLKQMTEEAALAGDINAAIKSAGEAQTVADNIYRSRKAYAQAKIDMLTADGREDEITDSDRIAVQENPVHYFDDVARRFNFDPSQLPPPVSPQQGGPQQAGPQTTQALPVAPRLPVQGGGLTASQIGAVNQAAGTLGIAPTDLLAVISYETGGRFDPDIQGGTGGNYQGLIQFGPQERAQYGYRPGMSFEEQVTGPVVNYLKGRGLPPGADLAQIYSVVNAGSLGPGGQPRWGASDGNNNVAGHVNDIMASHLPKAQAMLGGAGQAAGPAVPASGLAPMPAPMAGPATTGSTAPTDFIGNVNQMNKDGATKLYSDRGLLPAGAVSTQNQQQAQRAILMGDGAADPEAMQQARNFYASWASGSLPPHQEELLRSVSMYNATKEMYPDQPEKAKALASELLQSSLKEANKFQALSKAAAMKGNTDEALKAKVLSLQYVPNGVDPVVKKQPDGDFEVSFVRNGKTIHQEIVDPGKILATIMGDTPASSLQALFVAAGVEDKRPSEAMSGYLNAGVAEGPGMYLGAMQAPQRDIGQQDPYNVRVTGHQPPPGLKPDEVTTWLNLQKYKDEQAGGIRSPASASEQGERNAQVDKAWEDMVGVSTKLGGLETPNLKTGKGKDLDKANQALIVSQGPWIKEAAARATQHNSDLDATSALSGYLNAMKISPELPFGRPYNSTFLDDGTVEIAMNDGTGTFVVPAQDWFHLDQARYDVEKEYAVANIQAEKAKEAKKSAATETKRRGHALPTAMSGAPPIADYESFKDAYLKRMGPRVGLGLGGPEEQQGLERTIQQAWEEYRGKFPHNPMDTR